MRAAAGVAKDETERVLDSSESAKIKTPKKDWKKTATGSQAGVVTTSDEDEKVVAAKLSAVQFPHQKGDETATFAATAQAAQQARVQGTGPHRTRRIEAGERIIGEEIKCRDMEGMAIC